jgi:hypothetical protein
MGHRRRSAGKRQIPPRAGSRGPKRRQVARTPGRWRVLFRLWPRQDQRIAANGKFFYLTMRPMLWMKSAPKSGIAAREDLAGRELGET